LKTCDSQVDNIDEYIEIFIDECNKFFLENIGNISAKKFIIKILNDKDLKLTDEDKNTIFEMVIKKLNEKIYQ
jgi:hypothetical protein